LKSEHIKTRFVLTATKKQAQPPVIGTHRASAVMLPIIDMNDHAHILLCKRPTYLHHHPGEICLPGGKFEPQDINLRTTALRELDEELNIKASNITVLGHLPKYSTLTGFTISPFVGLLNTHTRWRNDYNEVQASFLVSLTDLSNEANWQSFNFQYFGKTITFQGFKTPHGLLWGATASIIKNFTKQLALPV